MRSEKTMGRRGRRETRTGWVQLVLFADLPRVERKRTRRQRVAAQVAALVAVQLVIDFERAAWSPTLTDEDIGREAYHLALRLLRRAGVAVTRLRAVERLALRAERHGPWGAAAASWLRLMAAQHYRPVNRPAAPYRKPGPVFEGAAWVCAQGIDWKAEARAAVASMYPDVPEDTWVSIEAARELGACLDNVRGGPYERRRPLPAPRPAPAVCREAPVGCCVPSLPSRPTIYVFTCAVASRPLWGAQPSI